LVEPKSWLSWRRGLTCGLRVVTVGSDVTTTELVTLTADVQLATGRGRTLGAVGKKGDGRQAS